jgi:hypothetical protein
VTTANDRFSWRTFELSSFSLPFSSSIISVRQRTNLSRFGCPVSLAHHFPSPLMWHSRKKSVSLSRLCAEIKWRPFEKKCRFGHSFLLFSIPASTMCFKSHLESFFFRERELKEKEECFLLNSTRRGLLDGYNGASPLASERASLVRRELASAAVFSCSA